MKKIYTAMIIGIILGDAMPAIAVTCNRTCTQVERNNAYVVTDTDMCDEVNNDKCEDGMIFASCVSCADGKTTLVQTQMVIEGCTYTYTTCECPSCTGCTSDSSWVSAGAGYEKKTTATCDCGTCNRDTSYRCASGYYGSSSNGSSGCTRCPNNGNSNAGSTSITSCYITGTFSDSTGSGTYTGSCYYSN